MGSNGLNDWLTECIEGSDTPRMQSTKAEYGIGSWALVKIFTTHQVTVEGLLERYEKETGTRLAKGDMFDALEAAGIRTTLTGQVYANWRQQR